MMLPFYIYYSMFGFQRVGDLIWAAADQRARGFLIGATAGRTTLGGEGLQHQDGSSQLIAGTIPNCRAYDPAFAYEMAVIFDHGARQMFETDGFGRGDTRAALRGFFEVDRYHIVTAALHELVSRGEVPENTVQQAMGGYDIGYSASPPWSR